jgi:hypothetical protein
LGIEAKKGPSNIDKIKAIEAWHVVLYSNEEKTNFITSKNSDYFYLDKSTGIISFKNIVRNGFLQARQPVSLFIGRTACLATCLLPAFRDFRKFPPFQRILDLF